MQFYDIYDIYDMSSENTRRETARTARTCMAQLQQDCAVGATDLQLRRSSAPGEGDLQVVQDRAGRVDGRSPALITVVRAHVDTHDPHLCTGDNRRSPVGEHENTRFSRRRAASV